MFFTNTNTLYKKNVVFVQKAVLLLALFFFVFCKCHNHTILIKGKLFDIVFGFISFFIFACLFHNNNH